MSNQLQSNQQTFDRAIQSISNYLNQNDHENQQQSLAVAGQIKIDCKQLRVVTLAFNPYQNSENNNQLVVVQEKGVNFYKVTFNQGSQQSYNIEANFNFQEHLNDNDTITAIHFPITKQDNQPFFIGTKKGKLLCAILNPKKKLKNLIYLHSGQISCIQQVDAYDNKLILLTGGYDGLIKQFEVIIHYDKEVRGNENQDGQQPQNQQANQDGQQIQQNQQANQDGQQIQLNQQANQDGQQIQLNQQANQDGQQIQLNQQANQVGQQIQLNQQANQDGQQIQLNQQANQVGQQIPQNQQANQVGQQIPQNQQANQDGQQISNCYWIDFDIEYMPADDQGALKHGSKEGVFWLSLSDIKNGEKRKQRLISSGYENNFYIWERNIKSYDWQFILKYKRNAFGTRVSYYGSDCIVWQMFKQNYVNILINLDTSILNNNELALNFKPENLRKVQFDEQYNDNKLERHDNDKFPLLYNREKDIMAMKYGNRIHFLICKSQLPSKEGSQNIAQLFQAKRELSFNYYQQYIQCSLDCTEGAISPGGDMLAVYDGCQKKVTIHRLWFLQKII
ncbi:unnamed protein product (macronuclear) [Paramecium tetraurelia]|uniref:WD40-repeat-containing domain n=1 Tax=Paramecium tetraurelia TaxID=5888 RepID=A0DHE9_PARTE|nr:uncharacterized protein GSPATT00016853001 [Paramecium tetraurelia]CAK82466.1 unnamed protein product [Paramecium tetraurelia]|eukprot:XP_001449863.1 hypothetical protein (macronuclear) [Paramecium tetraurelia strain d4-2]